MNLKNMDSQLDTLVVDDHEYPIQKPIAQYPAEYTVMQNRMIEAWNSMSIDEKRVFILASPIVRLYRNRQCLFSIKKSG